MSKHLKPCCYEGRALELQWKNSIYTSHDLFCGCLQPIEHLKSICKEEWHTTTKTTGTTTEDDHTATDKEDYVFTEGDLNALFENDTEDATG